MDRRTSLLGGRRSTDRTQWLDDLSNDLELRGPAEARNEADDGMFARSEKTGPTMSPARINYLVSLSQTKLPSKSRVERRKKAKGRQLSLFGA